MMGSSDQQLISISQQTDDGTTTFSAAYIGTLLNTSIYIQQQHCLLVDDRQPTFIQLRAISHTWPLVICPAVNFNSHYNLISLRFPISLFLWDLEPMTNIQT